jgi:uncharacterized membrane protein
VVLAGGVVFEAASLGVALRSLRRVRRGRSLAAFWRETRDPTLLTVLFEDTAALASLAAATAGIALAQATGWPLWDVLAVDSPARAARSIDAAWGRVAVR